MLINPIQTKLKQIYVTILFKSYNVKLNTKVELENTVQYVI